jgi:cytochrome c peroxidase
MKGEVMEKYRWISLGFFLVVNMVWLIGVLVASALGLQPNTNELDARLEAVLRQEGFTGRIEFTLEQKLGRPLNNELAEIGRLLWFDTITGLNNDNTCAGCHSPTAGFGDTQSIAIGIENNGIVGPDRSGPRNMRRTPMVINTAFYPNLMWNSRFAALSNDPFNNQDGFQFPKPEAMTLSYLPHLLVAQAFIPPTERTEVTGFHLQGDNEAIRAEVLNRLNITTGYRDLFATSFPEVKTGEAITFDMFGQAIAEFEYTLTFADAPIDQFARGEWNALTEDEKQGALLFFGEARCSTCHSVRGASNEMFSDFEAHVIAVPQIVPQLTNNAFDGPNANEDYGLEEFTGDPQDRYRFRTSPLRNVALQPSFMHNGAFTSLETAVWHHLNVVESVRQYSPADQQLAADLLGPLGPMEPVLARLDPELTSPVTLTDAQFEQLVAFVRRGLLDPRAEPHRLRGLVPSAVPSGRAVPIFQFPQ